MKSLTSLVLVALGTLALPVYAACPTDADAALMAARHANLQVVPNPSPDMTMADALCGREKFTKFLAQSYGKVIGYKAGLTNPAMQKFFNTPHPVRGTLFEKMILREGADVPAKFGARPVLEADLVVEVKDGGINKARTPLEALRHVSRIYPFIELPDALVEDTKQLTGPILVYINVAARLGILGKPIDVTPTPAFNDALASMTVKLVEEGGKELDSAKGSALLQHPMNAVLWLAGDLKKSGESLKKGQLLSLGTFSRAHPPKPGTSVRVIYEGLPGNPSVSVRFK